MIRLDPRACSGCGTCATVCPQGVLEVRDRVARLAHEERCMECAACQLNCREDAIRVTKGTGCLFAIIWEDVLRRGGARCG